MYLGIDCGSKSLGIAISEGYIARAYKTIFFPEHCWDKALQELIKVIDKLPIKVIILGYPLRANNNKSAATNMIIEFQRELLKVVSKNITVHFQDERYSTLEAEKLLIEYHISKKKHKVMIHQLAAAIILQSFLDHN